MTQVSVSIDDQDLDAIDAIAGSDDRSRSAVVRLAVRDWIERREAKAVHTTSADPDEMIPVDRHGMTVVEEGEPYEVDGVLRYVSYCGCTDGRHKGVYRQREPHSLPTEWKIHPVNVVAYEIVEAQ